MQLRRLRNAAHLLDKSDLLVFSARYEKHFLVEQGFFVIALRMSLIRYCGFIFNNYIKSYPVMRNYIAICMYVSLVRLGMILLLLVVVIVGMPDFISHHTIRSSMKFFSPEYFCFTAHNREGGKGRDMGRERRGREVEGHGRGEEGRYTLVD